MADMTLEEALAAATVDEELVTPVNEVLLINPETRKINIPESEKLFGVRQDMDAERKYFKCPKIVGDNIDLSKHKIFVNYVPSKQDGTYEPKEKVKSYWCEDLATDGDFVTFSWKLSANVMRKAGYIAFAVYAKTIDENGILKTKWHTTIAIGNVLETLPDGEVVEELYPDVIMQLLARMDNLESGEHSVLYVGQELTKEQQNQARRNIGAASSEEVDKLSEEKISLPKDVNGNTLKGVIGQVLKTNGDGTTSWVNQETYGLEDSDIEIIANKAAELIEKEEENLFSFDNANENIAQLSKNKPDSNYVYEQTGQYGHKDTVNGYFVFTPNGVLNYGIIGGLENPLPVGSYKLVADLYIPSGNTIRTTVRFGAFVAPSVYSDITDYDLGSHDTWVTVEKVITVSEGDTANYILALPYIDSYTFYIRNIKVISLNPELTGWKGKKWVVFGDSLTENNSTSLKKYHDYIAESTGITVENMGVSGTGYKNDNDSSQAFYQRISNVPADAEVVTIFGSGNDCGTIWETYGLGEVTDTGTDTICGCINTTIDNLYSLLPTVQLGIITPTPWDCYHPSATADPQNRMSLYSEAIVNICKIRGIPYLDLYHCSGLRPWDSNFKTLAYSKDDGGGTHPDETGHSIIAPRIKAFLESLIL